MSWHSGKRNSSLQHRILDSDSSSEEDRPNPFLYNAGFKARYLSVSCNHSNCANKFSRSANHKGNLDLVEDQDDEAFSDSCTHSGFCSCSKQANSASLNIRRGCVTSVAEYANKSLVISKPNSLNNSQSVNVQPTNAQPTNAQPIREVNVPSNSDYVEEVNAHSNSDFVEEVNDASALPYSHRLEDPFIGSNINNCNLISSDKFNEAQVVSNSSRQRFSSHNEEKNTAQRTAGNNTDSSVENNAASQVEKIPLMDSQPTTSNCLSVSSGALLYNWQATMTTVKERFAFLFNNEVLSDVHFRVGKGELSQRIPAHKFVLAVGSAVFDAMFNGKLCSNEDEIELPDVEPQAFLSLLRFLYSDDVHIGPETVMTVLYTAKKYAVPALERHCVEFLKCNLSSDNAFMLLTQARLFDEPQLAALCLDTIDKNTSDALLADGFTDIDHNTLCLVLERDTLRIREAKLFQAVVRWSVAQCQRENLSIDGNNQRTILEGALSLIRFPLMTIEEFAQGAAQSNILTDREVVQLFLHFTVNPKPTVNFLDTPRCCMTGKEQKVCRFPQIESRWGYSGTSDRIRFIVDRRIFIVGFGMYGSTHGPAEYEVTIQLIHTATGKVCASNDSSFVSDGSILTFRVMFKEPIEVLPNTNYTAYATLKGPDSHYGTKGVRKITVECPSGDRVTFQFTYAAGNNNGTSVEDGQIPEIIFYT